MEQESRKNKPIMEKNARGLESSGNTVSAGPIPCANNCGFFGNLATNNFCSKCYKEFVLNQSKLSSTIQQTSLSEVSTDLTKLPANTESSDPNRKGASNRCNFCRKRVGLTGFKCKCGHTFCSVHRYSDKHKCVFDYKSAGQDAIAKANPVIKADKIDKI